MLVRSDQQVATCIWKQIEDYEMILTSEKNQLFWISGSGVINTENTTVVLVNIGNVLVSPRTP